MASVSPSDARPARGTASGRVWEIADEITRQTGQRAARGEVIRRFQQEGGNANTASTQYHHWKTRFEARRGLEPAASDAPRTNTVQVRDGGRVVLPAEIREVLDLGEGSVLTVEVVDGEIRLTPRRTAIRKAQELVRQFIPEGVSLVDRLVEDRREEAGREQDG